MKALSVVDVAVPPQLEPFGLKRMHERFDPRSVGTGVTEEDFAHLPLGTAKSPSRMAWLLARGHRSVTLGAFAPRKQAWWRAGARVLPCREADRLLRSPSAVRTALIFRDTVTFRLVSRAVDDTIGASDAQPDGIRDFAVLSQLLDVGAPRTRESEGPTQTGDDLFGERLVGRPTTR